MKSMLICIHHFIAFIFSRRKIQTVSLYVKFIIERNVARYWKVCHLSGWIHWRNSRAVAQFYSITWKDNFFSIRILFIRKVEKSSKIDQDWLSWLEYSEICGDRQSIQPAWSTERLERCLSLQNYHAHCFRV